MNGDGAKSACSAARYACASRRPQAERPPLARAADRTIVPPDSFPWKLVGVFVAAMLFLGQRRPKGVRNKGKGYSIRDGDTLSELARKRYGSADKWQRIVDRNPRLISRDPDLIFPEEKINL
eukprot:scaffold3886_cov399-Prasinococcus_capsulatus_cf.AAC.24